MLSVEMDFSFDHHGHKTKKARQSVLNNTAIVVELLLREENFNKIDPFVIQRRHMIWSQKSMKDKFD